MEQKRVNLTLEKEVWQTFNGLVPQRKKSRIINELLRREIEKIKRQNEERILSSAFRQAAKDKDRHATISEWDSLDREGWE